MPLVTDDAELVVRARAGDRSAASVLFERYWTAAFRTAYAIVGRRDAAEDAAQEAFVRALAALDRFDTGRPFGPWLARIVANCAIDRLRADRRLAPLDADTAAEWAADVQHDELLPGGVGPSVEPTPSARVIPRRRRLLAVTAGIAVAATLAVAVLAGGLRRAAAPERGPSGATVVPPDAGRVGLGGVLAFLRQGVLYTVVDGVGPRAIARVPALQPGPDDEPRSVIVSADGSRIAVAETAMVRLYDRAGRSAGTIALSRGASPSRVAFSTDGAIVFSSERFDLYAYDRRGDRVIARTAADLISVAPDGSGLALNRADRSGLMLYSSALLRTCAADTCAAGARRLVPNETGGAGPVIWGPGPDQPIVYVDGRGLQLVSAAADEPVPVTVGADLLPVVFTRDGSALVVRPLAPPGPLELVPVERTAEPAGTPYRLGTPRRLAIAGDAEVLGATADDAALLVVARSGAGKVAELAPVDGGPAIPIDLGGAVEAIAWSDPTAAG